MTPVTTDVRRTAVAQSVAAQPATYGRLMRTQGLRPLLVSSLLTRTASQMWTVGIVLFTLQRYHSASVAGVSIFLLIFILAVAAGVIFGIVYIETAQRRIPIQYARRVVGRRDRSSDSVRTGECNKRLRIAPKTSERDVTTDA